MGTESTLHGEHPRGLARRIYFAFLLVAVIPTAIAGLIGIYASLHTLRTETLGHLQQEVVVRAQGISRFFDQLSAELIYLAAAPELEDVRAAGARGDIHRLRTATARLGKDYATLATTYPYIYQIRYLSAQGRELVRVDKKDGKVEVIPEHRLQDKSDRYYFVEAMKRRPGELYVSPLDLNVEFGRVETPERPVIRVATPIGSGARGNEGVLIINLHAGFLLEQIQQMAQTHSGTAYLFDRSGHYLARTPESGEEFSMQPTAKLVDRFGAEALALILSQAEGTRTVAGNVFAHAAIRFGAAYSGNKVANWVIAVGFPEKSLLTSVFNLYVLYAILAVSLLATAIGGFVISRHLLGPLDALSRETEAIAAGDFSRRIEVHGRDEIAALGEKFNAMAARIEQLVNSLANHRDRLEQEVRARTAELENEQEKRRELDQQMFQTEKMATMGELAMGVAHEIGNPLAGMKAVVQSMQFKMDLPPSIRTPLQRLEAEIDRLTFFLRTFHGLAAPEVTHREECSLAALLDDVLFWTRKEAKTRGVAIDCRGVDELPSLWADPQQFRQILLNLLLNAIHAMPDGGHIAVRVQVAGDRARIEVADSGHGIPADVLPHIFDPFFTTRSNGTGLGLSIVRKIAQQHSARIDVSSELGHGACFTLLWPLASVTM